MLLVSSLLYKIFSLGLVVGSLLLFLFGMTSVVNSSSYIIEWDVWGVMSGNVSMSLLFDWMSFIFLSLVCLISGCVMMYSEHYMEGEKNYCRFIFILVSFVGSMWLLIVSPNLISLLLGWDGLGLSSYALVIFYQSESSCNAGMITVLSNRIGDVGLLLSIGLMLSEGDWGFYWAAGDNWSMVLGLIILAAATKSAQVPFSAWLPAAMAAPTPVSALVHSSTLVTAGVYLLIRFSDLMVNSKISLAVVSVTGVMTMVMAGFSAMYEADMKKVVALSTLSQLGVMMMILGMGMKELAFFHLVTHALFKSTLFLCVGSMIHSVLGYQDSRVMSSFHKSSPLLGIVFSSTNLALCGFPFLAGFYSKDMILEYMFSSTGMAWVVFMGVVGTGLTVSYSFRVLYLSSGNISLSGNVSALSDLSLIESKSLAGLFMGSVLGGFFMSWVVVLSPAPFLMSGVEKCLVVAVSVLGGFLSHSWVQKNKFGKLKKTGSFLSGMWFLPALSAKLPSAVFMKEGYLSQKVMDSGWFEYYGGQGGKTTVTSSSLTFQKGQSSVMVSSYILTSFLGFVVLFFVI
nr:TPA_asm: ND5 [Echinogammarus veneris]